jgi:NADH dehydrogenase
MQKTLPVKKTRVLIVGGGFGGLYAALEFEKRRYTDIETTLISEENFFLFKGVTPREVLLTDDTRISSFTLVWTAGTSPHPLLNQLNLPKERNRLKVNAAMGAEGFPDVWALGDCALIPDEKGGYQPPTAQHASREGKVLAHNIVARIRGEDLAPFRFKTLGLLASIGRRTGVARTLGVNFSGFVAWWLWRTIYLLKLPRLEKKLRVALDWTLDVFFSKDFVQYLHERSPVFTDASTNHLLEDV